MRLEHLSDAGTDRFACPGLDGRVGRLLRLGTGSATIQWEHEKKTKTFTAKKYDKKTCTEVERVVTVPDRDPYVSGPWQVTLALEVEPLPNGVPQR